MKIFKPSRKNKLSMLIFSFFSLLVNSLLIIATCLALKTSGLSKNAIFMAIFSFVVLFLTANFFKIYYKTMMVSYILGSEELNVRRWNKESQVKYHDISNLKYEDKKLSFQDASGYQYLIPPDFEGIDELYAELSRRML